MRKICILLAFLFMIPFGISSSHLSDISINDPNFGEQYPAHHEFNGIVSVDSNDEDPEWLFWNVTNLDTGDEEIGGSEELDDHGPNEEQTYTMDIGQLPADSNMRFYVEVSHLDGDVVEYVDFSIDEYQQMQTIINEPDSHEYEHDEFIEGDIDIFANDEEPEDIFWEVNDLDTGDEENAGSEDISFMNPGESFNYEPEIGELPSGDYELIVETVGLNANDTIEDSFFSVQEPQDPGFSSNIVSPEEDEEFFVESGEDAVVDFDGIIEFFDPDDQWGDADVEARVRGIDIDAGTQEDYATICSDVLSSEELMECEDSMEIPPHESEGYDLWTFQLVGYDPNLNPAHVEEHNFFVFDYDEPEWDFINPSSHELDIPFSFGSNEQILFLPRGELNLEDEHDIQFYPFGEADGPEFLLDPHGADPFPAGNYGVVHSQFWAIMDESDVGEDYDAEIFFDQQFAPGETISFSESWELIDSGMEIGIDQSEPVDGSSFMIDEEIPYSAQLFDQAEHTTRLDINVTQDGDVVHSWANMIVSDEFEFNSEIVPEDEGLSPGNYIVETHLRDSGISDAENVAPLWIQSEREISIQGFDEPFVDFLNPEDGEQIVSEDDPVSIFHEAEVSSPTEESLENIEFIIDDGDGSPVSIDMGSLGPGESEIFDADVDVANPSDVEFIVDFDGFDPHSIEYSVDEPEPLDISDISVSPEDGEVFEAGENEELLIELEANFSSNYDGGASISVGDEIVLDSMMSEGENQLSSGYVVDSDEFGEDIEWTIEAWRDSPDDEDAFEQSHSFVVVEQIESIFERIAGYVANLFNMDEQDAGVFLAIVLILGVLIAVSASVGPAVGLFSGIGVLVLALYIGWLTAFSAVVLSLGASIAIGIIFGVLLAYDG